MRLAPLYRVRFRYPESWAVGLGASGSPEGQHFFLAEGRCEGRIAGTFRGANHPRRRSDGTFLPDFQGVITTTDGAVIYFDVIEQLYEAFGRGEIPAVLAMFDPAIEWTSAEGAPYPGTFVGPQAVLDGVFMRLGTEWEGFRADATEFIDGGDQVVAPGRYRGTYRATGRSRSAAFAHVCTLHDGRIVRFRQYLDSRKPAEAL